MDKQKATPQVSKKITRKLASESSEHKDVMNYYSTISRDETGAPVKWKMNMVHEEVVPGRASPALAKIARSRSNSRDSSSERKKLDQDNQQSKLSASGKKGPVKKTENANNVESEINENDNNVDLNNATNEDFEEKNVKINESLDKALKVKKRRRPRSEPFTHIKKRQNKTVKHAVNKDKNPDKTGNAVRKKRGRPKSLDLLNNESFETVANGEEDFFKSPHPLTPCNILVKPKKGRPKETPPTLEPEPSLSQNAELNAELNADTFSGDTSLCEKEESKRKNGPGRQPKKKFKSADAVALIIDKNRNPNKINQKKKKLIEKTKMMGKRKPVLPLKAKRMIFKRKKNLTINKAEILKASEGKIKRKGGRPPGSKNKPKPVSTMQRESMVRQCKNESENSEINDEVKTSEANDPNKIETCNINIVSDKIEPENTSHISMNINSIDDVIQSVVSGELPKKDNKLEKNENIEGKVKRKGGRPPGSKNKPKPAWNLTTIKHGKKDFENSSERRSTSEINTENSDISSVSLINVNSAASDSSEAIKQELLSTQVRDTLRKQLLSKGKVNPKSKAMKAERSLTNMKRKRLLITHAKKYTEASIASLPFNDLRRKLYKISQTKLANRGKDEKKNTDKNEDSITLSELRSETELVHTDGTGVDIANNTGIQVPKPSPEVQNLSAMVESKRFTKVERDKNMEINRKRGRPPRSILDVKELGKFSDSESTCSEISSFSSISNSSIRKQAQNAATSVEQQLNIEKEMTKVKKRLGRKRKNMIEKMIEKDLDLGTKPAKMATQYDTLYDFVTDDEASKQTSSIQMIKKRPGQPHTQKCDDGITDGKSVFKSTLKRPGRPPKKKNVLKHFNRGKLARSIKTVKPELRKLKRKKQAGMLTNESPILHYLYTKSTDKLLTPGIDTGIKSELNSSCDQKIERIDFKETETKVGNDHAKVTFSSGSLKNSVHRDHKDRQETLFKNDITGDGTGTRQEGNSDAIDKEINSHFKTDVKNRNIKTDSSNLSIAHQSGESDEKEQETELMKFDSKSILDRAKAISFEVNEKKRLLKEKILKGREFNKSFIHKAVEVNDANKDSEGLLPDNEMILVETSSFIDNTDLISAEIDKNEIDKENQFLSDDGTDEINIFEPDNESAEGIVEEILFSMIDRVCRQVSCAADKFQGDSVKNDTWASSLYNSTDEKNIREYLGHIPDSVQSMKTFNIGSDNSQSVTFKKRKPVHAEPVKWRKRIRRKEKNSTAEMETPTVRKIGLRQKISRSPLDNIALKQSIEENEYMREQMKKTRRGPKPKVKQSPSMEPEEILGSSALLEPDNVIESMEVTDNTETSDLLEESSSVPAVSVEDFQKHCRPCSVVLKDFLKQLQMKNTFENSDDSQDGSQISDDDESEKNDSAVEEKVDSVNIVVPAVIDKSGVNIVAPAVIDKSGVNIVAPAGEHKSGVNIVASAVIDKSESQLINDFDERKEESDGMTYKKDVELVSNEECFLQNDKCTSYITLVEDKKFSNKVENVEQRKEHVAVNTGAEAGPRRRGRKPFKGVRKTPTRDFPQKSLRPRAVAESSPKAQSDINKSESTKDKQKDHLKSETNGGTERKSKVGIVDNVEQTARKTVPPLKIKLQGGLTSKTKVYTVENAVNTNPSSVDSALDRKPKKKFKSKSKSDSESEKSEKRKSHHHHTKKHSKSPDKTQEMENIQSSDKQAVTPQKADALKANDPYEANFLAFIQQQEKEESVSMVNWRNPVVTKASHLLVGGKACKTGDDGSLTVSACALAETKTSSFGSEKFVTVSRSSASSIIDNTVKHNVAVVSGKTESAIKKSDLEHFQQTENVVSDLASVVPTNKQFFCNHCEFLCETQNEIMEHTKSLHKDQLLYSCTICNKVTFKTKPAILAHFATYHKGMKDSYICLPDYYEKQIEPKLVRSPTEQPDNIFDRMSNLFDIQSSKEETNKIITSCQTEKVGASKTAAEADSTTKFDEGEDHISNTAVSLNGDSVEELTAEPVANPGHEGAGERATSVNLSEPANTADTTEEADNEMNIKIVDVVSLKGQGEFDVDNTIGEEESHEDVAQKPVESISTSKVPVHVKPSELKIPSYPVAQLPKSVTATFVSAANAPAKVLPSKKPVVKTGTTYKCEACHVHAPVLAALVAHLKNSHTNIPKLFQCPYCRDMEGETEALIHQHIKRCHPTDNPNPPVALSEPAKRNLKTLNVELPEKAESAMLERDLYMCLRCKKHFPSLEMTYNHLELEHREVFVYVCPFCKVFKAKEEFVVNTHVLNVHHPSIEDINISLAIDGTQFLRVSSLIKDKGLRTGHKSTPSPSQINKPQSETRPSPNQAVPSLTIPFNQNMAPLNQTMNPLNPALKQNITQIQQSLNPQSTTQVRPPQLQGARKRKATLSESIAQLTLQRQRQEANKVQGNNNNAGQQCATPSLQQPPPLLRGPPPLIRYDQLTKVPASLVAAQQLLQASKANNSTTVTSNILGQLSISAAERLQTLNHSRGQPSQIQNTPRQIQSSLFDTSDPSSFLPVTRKQPGPVLNIPQISRAANRPLPQQGGQPMQRNLITGSPLDLSNKSTPEPSPPADSKNDENNPEAFKIFNLLPSAPQPQPNITPQFVRPDTTSTLAYRPTTPHVANVPISAVNMVPISLGNISLQQMQNIPQFVRLNFPQALQQVVTSQTLQQIVIPQSLQQVVPTQTVQQVVIPQSMSQVQQQPVQQIIVSQSSQEVATSANVTQGTSIPQSVMLASLPQSVVTVSSVLQTNPSTASLASSTAVVSEATKQATTADQPQEKETTASPLFKCPYCPQVIKLKLEEVKPHIEEKHPGSQVLLMPLS